MCVPQLQQKRIVVEWIQQLHVIAAMSVFRPIPPNVGHRAAIFGT